jgi:osmoprotectant transport system ATP-binding protein
MTEIIRFDNISKVFNGKTVIDRVSFTVQEGEFFVIVGPSGSGKTTLLKMINALHAPSEGAVYLRDKKIETLNIRRLRWKMGYVLQQIALFPTMTVEENIDVIPEMIGWSKDKRKKTVRRLLEDAQLDPNIYASRMPSSLSGGEQQRVGILRAIAAEPDVILMDEPFSALDPISRAQLQNLMLDLHKKFANTVIFVTHDMNEAMKLADRIAIMKEGRLIQCASPDEIEKFPADSFVAEFFQHTNGDSMHKITMEDVMAEITLMPTEPRLSEIFVEEADCLIEAFSLLAVEDVIGVKKQGEPRGFINAKMMMSYLSQRAQRNSKE